MEAGLKRFLIIFLCIFWGIIAYHFHPWSIFAAKGGYGGLFGFIASIIIGLSCTLNHKICSMFDIQTNLGGVASTLSLFIQIVIYFIIGLLISFAKPRRKKASSKD